MLWLNLTIGLIFFVYLGRVMHTKKNSTRDKLNYNIKQQCAGKFARLLIIQIFPLQFTSTLVIVVLWS